MRIPTRAVVTVFEPVSRYGYNITTAMSPAPSRMRYALERVEGGTKLTLSNEFMLPRLMMVLGSLLRRSVQGMFERDVDRLRKVIETGVART